MEKSKKSQSGKSLFKNLIKSVKFDLKNFQNIFIISIFLVFIFIMAATAISVWLSKQAEPPTVEEYCANCRVLDVQQEENLLKYPSTALPVLRIFGKDIQVCHQACQNLRPIFNIQFECVPMVLASKETIKEVYGAIDFLEKGEGLKDLVEEEPVDNKDLNEIGKKYVISSSTVQGKVKITNQGIAPVSQNQNTQNNQKEADQAVANLFLESNSKTVFFIDGHILVFNGIPNKENICEVVNDPACPLKNSSFIPEEKFFGLVKDCYAWISGAGGSPFSGGRGRFIAGGSPNTRHNSNHWARSSSSSPSPSSSHTHLPTTTFNPNFFSGNAVSNWSGITWNANGSVTIGGNGPNKSSTAGHTGTWSNGTFNIGGVSSQVLTHSGGNSFNTSSVNLFFGNNKNTKNNKNSKNSSSTTQQNLNLSFTFKNVKVDFTSVMTMIAGINWQKNVFMQQVTETMVNIKNANQQNSLKISSELLFKAAPAESAWIAKLLPNPKQNFYYAGTHPCGVNVGVNAQANALIKGNSATITTKNYIAFGKAKWEDYFYSGSPSEITTHDGSNWKLTMMTHTAKNGSTEFLSYNPAVNNGDGTFGNFVPYDSKLGVAWGYQKVDKPVATAAAPAGPAGPAIPPPPPPPIPPANNPPIAAIECYPSCELTTKELQELITISDPFTLRESHGDPDGDPVTCNWTIDKCQNPDCSVKANFLNSNVCSNLSPSISQVGHYQARFKVNDGEYSIHAIPDPLNFYILQGITAMFDYEPEKPHYGEEIQFLDQSVGTGKPGGTENYNITNWNWTFEDIEGKEATQTFTTTNSNEKDPIITFTENGDKKVTLTVIDETGRSATWSDNVEVGFPPPNWRETHPGEKQYDQQGQESCREKCESFGYMYGICREWPTLSETESGCRFEEEDIGETFDCKGSAEIEKTCCCRYLQW